MDMEGYIEIEKLRIYARHGVLPQERKVGNIFEVSLRLCYDMAEAADGDDITHAIDYSQVCLRVKEICMEPSALLENVVKRIKDMIDSDFPMVLGGKIKVAKLTPPMGLDLQSVAVVYEW